MSKTILVVAAHSDDEALGCAGTLARHVAEGDTVHAVFLADGVSSRESYNPEELNQRMKATEQARKILGIHSLEYLNLPDNKLDSLPLIDIIQPLEKVIASIDPQVIYTHHNGDLNVDHRLTHQAVLTACRPLPNSRVKEILTFEVMSSTEWNSPNHLPFLPNLFVDISKYLDEKIGALQAYALEMRNSPHSRSIEHLRSLAQHRGHCIGVEAAEAFMVIRIVR
ncbi:PIG-L deacetylase family protein [Pseudomonas caricapapayae]|uniref:PIG-L deacetylase family protein n=1 Tax=Pseudomonas caricapapayae TaxID=46678 RepID=A0ACC7LZW3_9PSED